MYDPEQYLKDGGTLSGGFAENHSGFGKYSFRPIKWSEETKDGTCLYIGRPQDFPADSEVIKVIKFPDGEEAFKIVKG